MPNGENVVIWDPIWQPLQTFVLSPLPKWSFIPNSVLLVSAVWVLLSLFI